MTNRFFKGKMEEYDTLKAGIEARKAETDASMLTPTVQGEQPEC